MKIGLAFYNLKSLICQKHPNKQTGQPAKTYIDLYCVDTGCRIEDLRKWWPIGTDGERELRKSEIKLCLGENDDVISSLFFFLIKYN